jgi:hypothetical protein
LCFSVLPFCHPRLQTIPFKATGFLLLI